MCTIKNSFCVQLLKAKPMQITLPFNEDQLILLNEELRRSGFHKDDIHAIADFLMLGDNIKEKRLLTKVVEAEGSSKKERFLFTCIRNKMSEFLLKAKGYVNTAACAKSLSLQASPYFEGSDEAFDKMHQHNAKAARNVYRRLHTKLLRVGKRPEAIELFEVEFPHFNKEALEYAVLHKKFGTTKEDLEIFANMVRILARKDEEA
jgi:hypothetical protein